jgi:hypothetical protein
MHKLLNLCRVDARNRRLFDRFAIADAPAERVGQTLVAVGPHALQNGSNLDLDTPGRQPKPDMDGSVTLVRVVAQIMNSRLLGTEVIGDLSSESCLFGQQ